MRLKLDENLGSLWREQFREAGHDVDAVIDGHLSGASDNAVLDAAVSANRALVTLDIDFANPFQFPPHRTSGIAVLRVHGRPGRNDISLVVASLIVGLARRDLTARLWVVEPDRIRQYEPSGDNEH